MNPNGNNVHLYLDGKLDEFSTDFINHCYNRIDLRKQQQQQASQQPFDSHVHSDHELTSQHTYEHQHNTNQSEQPQQQIEQIEQEQHQQEYKEHNQQSTPG
jgi:hypothetical protein